MEHPSFLTNSPTLYFIKIDTGGKIIFANSSFKEKFALLSADLINIPSSRLIIDADIPEFNKALQNCAYERKTTAVITRMLSAREGLPSPFYIQWEFSPAEDRYGKFNAITGIGYPIADNKTASQEIINSEKKYHTLFEQASDPIMITDYTGNFIDVNTSMCKLFGYTKEELVKMNISALIDPGELKIKPIRFDLLAIGQHIFNNRNMLHKNGKLIQVEANVKKIDDTMVMAIARNITELTEAQKQIELSEAKFRGAFERSAIGMALVSLEGNWLKVNKELCNLTGYNERELLALRFQDITHPDDLGKDLDFFHQSIKGEIETYQVEKRYYHKNGSVIWINLNTSLVKDDHAKPIYFISQIEDITKRKTIEANLEESEKSLRYVLSSSADNFYVIDKNHQVILINKAAERNLEKAWGQKVILGVNILDCIPEETDEPIKKSLASVLAGENIEYELKISVEGLPAWVLVNYVPVKNDHGIIIGACVFTRDISDRKKAEEDALEQKEQLLRFVKHSPVAIAMLDNDMKYIIVSQRWMEDYNLGQQDVAGKSHYEVFPDLPQHWKDIHQRCLAGAIEKSDEDSFTREDGRTDWLHWEVHPWYKAKGEIGGIIMLTEVITEKKNIELELKEAEIKFRSLVEKSLAGVYIMQNGKFTYVNPVFAEIFGYEPGELVNSYPVEIVVHEEDRPRVLENIRTRMQDEIDSVHYEARGCKKDGQTIWMEVFGSRTLYKGNTAIIGTLIDITEKKIMEQEILNQKIQEQKKISRAIINAQEKERNFIGQELHDNICQLLVGTKLHLGIAGKKDKKVQELISYPMKLIDNSIDEIRSLSSRQVTPLKKINLKELVQLLVDELNESTTTKTAFVCNLPKLSNDDLKLNMYRIIQEQLNNIVKHAGAKNVHILLEAVKSAINIVVTDDGKGFDVNKKRKGIGISNMLNRIESFNGQMVIESSPGNGCTIQISIPY